MLHSIQDPTFTCLPLVNCLLFSSLRSKDFLFFASPIWRDKLLAPVFLYVPWICKWQVFCCARCWKLQDYTYIPKWMAWSRFGLCVRLIRAEPWHASSIRTKKKEHISSLRTGWANIFHHSIAFGIMIFYWKISSPALRSESWQPINY